MNLGIALFILHLTMAEFVSVLSSPRRNRLQGTIPASSTSGKAMSERHNANRMRRLQKQTRNSNDLLVNTTAGLEVTTPLLACNGQCDRRLCPVDRCQDIDDGEHCRCCSFCHSLGVTTHRMVVAQSTGVNACDQLTCPRNKVCLLNIQGLPMCRCLSVYHCKGTEKRQVCTEGNRTFNNKCLVRVEECASNRRIRTLHKGPCQPQTMRRPNGSSERHAPSWRKRHNNNY